MGSAEVSAAQASTASTSRRQQIIQVAAGLFAEHGYRGVSIYDIGTAMGTSGPALYKHFPSKDALLAAMLIDISQRLLDEGRRRAEASTPEGPDAVLASLVAWHVEFALHEPALITVQFRDLASLAEEDQHTVRQLQRKYVELWVRTIRASVGVDERHARSAAHATFGLINSTPHSARLSRGDMADQLCRMSLAALYACGPETHA